MFTEIAEHTLSTIPHTVDNKHLLEQHVQAFEHALAKEKIAVPKYYKTLEPLFTHIFSISPFLSQNIIRDVRFWHTVCDTPAQEIFDTLIEQTQSCWNTLEQTQIMKNLRLYKNRMVTLCAFMDIAKVWGVMQTAEKLSLFASTACHSTLNHCLLKLQHEKVLTNRTKDDPAKDSGFCLLGMGKLGAKELNYSSDIDLIAFVDLDKVQTPNRDIVREKSVKSFKNFITIMEQKTVDGYVFRTDFRLRPNPSMTPILLTKTAMLNYYESMGENWERFAMIKARPIAGNIAIGNSLLRDIKSFIWRKNLDFIALEDIFIIKNKINTGSSIKIAGHNIKLGLGGIREIEFFAQAHQVIWGGRLPELRDRQTLTTLDKLVTVQHYKKHDIQQLKDAYLYYRTLEHRLQMINDTQTHTIAQTAEGIETIAKFMSAKSPEDFAQKTLKYLTAVHALYEKLFQKRHISGTEIQNPTTVDMLKFADKKRAEEILALWFNGQYKALKTEKAKHLIHILKNTILQAIANTSNPDETLMRFDAFLEKLPAGVQLFSLFKSYPSLLTILANIMGNAPRLASELAQQPSLLDSLVTNRYVQPVPSEQDLRALLQSSLNDTRDFQDILHAVRRFKAEFFFEQGVRILQNIKSPSIIAKGLSVVANVSIEALIQSSIKAMVDVAGEMKSGSFAVLAFGKLGGEEILHRSDVDLVFVYNHRDMNKKSHGPRGLYPLQYYTRLCQRIITAISAHTEQGQLFDVDVRLRPNGNKGALAVHINSFQQYYQKPEAWTWEFMALTRVRVLFSTDDTIKKAVENILHTALVQKRQTQTLLSDVLSMRRKLEQTFYDNNPYYIKHRPGGLIDIEFICQTLQLRYAHEYPEILQTNTHKAYTVFREKALISQQHYDVFTKTLHLWQDIQGIVRLTTSKRFVLQSATQGQISTLLKCTNFDSVHSLQNTIERLAKDIRLLFNRYMEH